AVELAPKGVRVNAVAPGAIKTPRVLAATTEERREASARSIPLGRMGEPEEIAKVVTFLASDLASYVTGQTLVADGRASVKFRLRIEGAPSGGRAVWRRRNLQKARPHFSSRGFTAEDPRTPLASSVGEVHPTLTVFTSLEVWRCGC